MAGFDVGLAMQTLYRRLVSLGFHRTSSEPDEWERPHRTYLDRAESGYQVKINHVSGSCEIRHRRTPRPLASGAIMADVEHDRSHPWSLLAGRHGDDLDAFTKWLQLTAGTLEQHLSALALGAEAPGE